MAMRIFDLGLKKFGHEPDYALAFIDYLSHLNGKCSHYFNVYLLVAVNNDGSHKTSSKERNLFQGK